MKTLALLLLLLARPALSEQSLSVRRGTLEVKVRVTGTVVTEDVIRLKATIDGRVEDVFVSTGSWALSDQPLGHLANKEMAALLDAHSTTEKGVLEERWRQVYQPTAINCPRDCYVLRSFVKPKEWLKARALLFEAAQGLRLVARVRPEDVKWIHDGQAVEFWDVGDPSRKLKGQVEHFVLDVQGERVAPGGTFWIEGTPDRYLPPGTQWEGQIVPVIKHDVLIAPTAALLEYKGQTYLPVKVSTGITTETETEITAGTDSGRDILLLDDSSLKDSARHAVKADLDEIMRARNPSRIETEKENPAPRVVAPLPDPDAVYGDDPYGQ
jgi:predicted RNA-binding protein